MEFSVKSGSPEKQRTACVVVGVFEPRRLSPIAEQLDHVSGGFLGNLLRRGDMEGKFGQVLLLHNVPNTLCDRVLLVGCGRERELGDQQYRKIIAKAIHTLNDTGSMEAVCFLTELNVKGRDIGWKVRHGVEASTEALYRFDKFKSKKDSARRPLRKLVYSVPTRRDLPGGEQAVQEGLAISNGINFCKDLANMPPNLCHPTYLAEEAQALAGRSENLKVTILDQAEMEKLRMGALLSVARGSRQPPKLIIMEYKGGEKSEKPIVIIGKGVTFDSGGISIKPSANMDEMKYDMCG
ncbi:MAG TPA: leucyl aminopeptidase, partial [Gammaproteobacteria bacterium]|nr:leucyl aminopeptidase [Gammaproteobacteria bacterium]